MYEIFLSNNKGVRENALVHDTKELGHLSTDVVNFFNECGGSSFNNGLYRTHSIASCIFWADIIGKYFSTYNGKIIPFGYDWMGRQFALDVNAINRILMFDAATAEDFELQESIVSFHNHSLVYDQELTLAKARFHEVLHKLNLPKIGHSQRLSFKVPLFLGGGDTVENYEISDMEVSWEFECQIYLQIKDLPPGTKINSINFK